MATDVTDIKQVAKNPRQKVFRRAFIKRRQSVTGTFESEWTEITEDVKKWGKLKNMLDASRFNQVKFGNMTLKMDNTEGKYNDETDQNSLWFNTAGQQRTLLRIETGFEDRTMTAAGIWDRSEYPSSSLWDDELSYFDRAEWDSTSIVFLGLISGDIPLNDKSEVTLRSRPLLQIFKDYAAQNISGYDTSMTASKFMELVRDHTAGGSYIFRPFFDNTSSNFDISATSIIYSNLNTSGAKDIRDRTVWNVMERLSEAENYQSYVSNKGVFRFIPKDATSTVSWEFYGVHNSQNREYGETIKNIFRYGPKLQKYYSRVQVKWQEPDTSTSYEIREATMTVNANSAAWNLGERTYRIDNTWIPDQTTAASIADTVFNDVSSLKNEIEFSSSYVPHLDVQDRISVTYDASEQKSESLWDLNEWGEAGTTTGKELIWDNSKGNAIKLNAKEFKILSYELDLDNFTTKIIARES